MALENLSLFMYILSLFSSDEMLREVITLSTSTSEGQARASACELLHALFLVSVAKEQQTPKKIKVSSILIRLA